MKKLTIKQEKFCQEYIITGNASEAYRRAYNASNMKDKTITEKASRLLTQDNISARVGVLKGELENKFEITKEKLANILMNRVLLFEQMQELAQKPQLTSQEYDKYTRLIGILKASDSNKAIDQLAKMFGYNEPEKQEIKHTGLEGFQVNIKKSKKDD